METKESYSFPLYHRIGQAVRPIIASRYWIVIVLVAAVLLYIPFLSAGFFQDDYGFRLNFSPEAYEKLGATPEIFQNGKAADIPRVDDRVTAAQSALDLLSEQSVGI